MIDFGLGAYDDLQARQEDGVDVPIYDPGTDVVLFTIHVHGTDSKRVDRARQRRDEEAAARGALSPMTPEELVAEASLFLARCCSGWEVKNPKATLPPFSDEACAEMLRRYRPIRDTIDGRVSNRAVFIKRSPTASPAPSGTASPVALSTSLPPGAGSGSISAS